MWRPPGGRSARSTAPPGLRNGDLDVQLLDVAMFLSIAESTFFNCRLLNALKTGLTFYALATGTPTRALDGKLALGHGTDAIEFVSFVEGLPGLLRDLETELEAQAKAPGSTVVDSSTPPLKAGGKLKRLALLRKYPVHDGAASGVLFSKDGLPVPQNCKGGTDDFVLTGNTGIVGRRWQRGAAHSIASLTHSLAPRVATRAAQINTYRAGGEVCDTTRRGRHADHMVVESVGRRRRTRSGTGGRTWSS